MFILFGGVIIRLKEKSGNFLTLPRTNKCNPLRTKLSQEKVTWNGSMEKSNYTFMTWIVDVSQISYRKSFKR